jgi:hypothetical protein
MVMLEQLVVSNGTCGRLRTNIYFIYHVTSSSARFKLVSLGEPVSYKPMNIPHLSLTNMYTVFDHADHIDQEVNDDAGTVAASHTTLFLVSSLIRLTAR